MGSEGQQQCCGGSGLGVRGRGKAWAYHIPTPQIILPSHTLTGVLFFGARNMVILLYGKYPVATELAAGVF